MSFSELEKLFQIAQYSIVYFLLGLIFGFLIVQMFPRDNQQSVKNRSTAELFMLCLLQVSANGIMIYYIHKIASKIPFLFRLTENYEQTLIQSITGVNLAISFSFKDLQSAFIARVRELCRRMTLCVEM